MATDNEVTGHQERTEEFDAFGPWVYRVRTDGEVPRLFRRFAPDPASATMVIKIPRGIARRDANPQMDLYDHLVGLRGDRLTLLSRAPGEAHGVRRREVATDRIVALEDSVELLDGRLSVRVLDEKPMTVGYNGASRDVVGEFVAALRSAIRGGPPPEATGPAPELGLEDLWPDVALTTEYRELVRAEPAMGMRAAHARRVVEPVEPSTVSRLLHRWWPMWLQGAVVCSDPSELLVLHRRSWWVRGGKPVHSIARTSVPLGHVLPVETVPTGYHGVTEIRVRHDAARFAVPSGSPTERVLLELLG
ncbi:hypothetical protein Q6348_05040 [Isoptericola sp. b441]|uniref:Uncharacterized protein n=1 Tax=Actinotalea lenta TaxID=3064654 RepID=A0ABT9D6U4_9CELL|nr:MULTISPECIES: hypothetical protein [unclassified Isoptericola]MDO8106559.1 hypothetical protein [Isoptericola sp. b441]MDO8121733.1 hypothetical protein [Isoptericola sp. b490]